MNPTKERLQLQLLSVSIIGCNPTNQPHVWALYKVFILVVHCSSLVREKKRFMSSFECLQALFKKKETHNEPIFNRYRKVIVPTVLRRECKKQTLQAKGRILRFKKAIRLHQREGLRSFYAQFGVVKFGRKFSDKKEKNQSSYKSWQE